MPAPDLYHVNTLALDQQVRHIGEIGKPVGYHEILRELEKQVPVILIRQSALINGYTVLGGTSIPQCPKEDLFNFCSGEFHFGPDHWSLDFFNGQ